jgi:hypothetical protein
MTKRTRDVLIGTVAVAAAAVSIYFALGGRSQKIDFDTYSVLGAVTAEETAKLIGNKGQVVVMVRDTGANKNPSVEAELKAFQQVLKSQKGISVLIENIKIPPMQMMATGGGVPPDQFLKTLETHAGVGALVLFMGFPQLTDSELEVLKKSGAKTVVACPLRPGDQQLIERDYINLALVPRSEEPSPNASAPRTVRERFDREFMILTAAAGARQPGNQ